MTGLLRSLTAWTVFAWFALATAEEATFLLFDNGASEGGVTVTLTQEDFPVSSDETGPAGELFAVQMSKYIDVAKYSFEPGTVLASKAFREDGEKIQAFDQLLPIEEGVPRRVYLVAEGLEFIWPFIELGHKQVVSPRALTPIDPEKPVVVESVSDSPRVFIVHNMFTVEEGQALIDNAMNLTGESALKRSTVGNSKDRKTGARQDNGRTSDNAWDSKSPVAKAMITRSFNLTGIVESAGKIDGLQIVRYKPGQFYNKHPDYFQNMDDKDFDFHPYSGGSNRFATVFMYLNDVEEGGCTVFPKAESLNPSEPPQHALDMFDSASREYGLLEDCHGKLAVPPKAATAALFYSITPDGRIDKRSMHGACPVIKGLKWGANIWIWNRQRYGDIKTGEPRTLRVDNHRNETVYITWEGRDNGVLEPGGKYQLNTFEFHRFKAHEESYKGPTFAEFTVEPSPMDQEWIITPVRQLRQAEANEVPSPTTTEQEVIEEKEEDREETKEKEPEMGKQKSKQGLFSRVSNMFARHAQSTEL